jgi:mycofactocin precursor
MADSATELLDQDTRTDTPREPAGAPRRAGAAVRQPDAEPDQVLAADLLVAEISIDGMCGVY